MLTGTSETPRSFGVAAALVSAAGIGVLCAAFRQSPVPFSSAIAILMVAALVSENFSLSLPSFNVSLALPFIVAAFVLVGPAGGALIAALCFTNIQEIREHRPLTPLLFNFGQLVLAAGLGGFVYQWAGGTTLHAGSAFKPLDAGLLPGTMAATIVAALVVFAVNVALTAYAVSTLRGCSALSAARAMATYIPTQLSLALVGLLMAQVLAIASVALLLFLFPLVLARQVFQRYEDMQDAFLDTVRSLVAALEAKDPYTRGHSERVAAYAMQIGEHTGLDRAALNRLQTAALLHDIGKLALPVELLTKPSALSAAEIDAMHRHPAAGANMVERIPPLKSIAATVRMHHERIDGTGYPCGVPGRDIPFAARILAVADAYDAMTTKRAYRCAMSQEDAFRELLVGVGTQFDPDAVRGLMACTEDTAEPSPDVTARARALCGEVAQ